ncbi:MAG TPA: winged helix-turn-helix domain-containing protein, partial [Vicinamibacterales bacterium]|nr:winged helix-turn-helix domain-containing protein [Vicinamibacterales bacterium]
MNGEPAPLTAPAFELLSALARRRERVVSKQELLRALWPEEARAESELLTPLAALRELLGPAVITTIPGRGYRFVAAVDDDVSGAAPAPVAAVAAAARTNLPAQLPVLFGRETDVAALETLLVSERLVTIVGTGGIGKTRLATAAAHAASSGFPDGVWLVELAPVGEPALVQGTVARTLGVPLDADASAPQLAQRIADRQLLLVLDNCEHLLDGVAPVVAALHEAAPGVCVLATSQEPLKLPGEQVYRLATLACPVEESLASARAAGAVALFEARARAADSRFTLDAGNLGAVIEICRRLDGIALAIELAAARVPLLGVDGLRQRLADRFKVLTAGARLAPRRHQTLRAALDWSYTLLNGDEQRVFQCLGVFAGGFGLEAAQRVAAAEGLDEWAVLDHLGALVDKSLVVVEPDAAGGTGPRYALLESARAFALERLEEAGGTPATARRHALAVLDGFERSVAEVWTTPMDALLPRVLPDIDNLRAALEWAAGEDATTLTALAGASWWLWKPALVPAEGLRWCETAIGRIDATTPHALEARLRYGYANLSHLSAAERELAALRRAAELYGEIGDRQGAYLALTRLAQKLAWRYDLSAAAQAAQDAAVLWDADWPPVMREDLLLARTYVLEASGRAAEGQPLMEELVALMRGLGDARKLDVALIQFAENLVVQGKDGQAIEVRREVAQRVADRRVDYAGTNLANLSAALTFH